ncbi:hypothetical protein G6F46_013724 [Rhizopus delemar]|nr:hypothetical protein G6F46_013724 [Rhizopus delemar]
MLCAASARIEPGGLGEQQVSAVLAGTAAIELALQPLPVQLAGTCGGEGRAGEKADRADHAGDIEAGQAQRQYSCGQRPRQAQQQGDERTAAARALPGVLQGVHAATLRWALLAIQRSSANSSTMASNSQGVGSRGGGVTAGNAARCGAWSRASPSRGAVGGCSASSRALAGQRQQLALADALLP